MGRCWDYILSNRDKFLNLPYFSLGAYIAKEMGLGIFEGKSVSKYEQNNKLNIKYARWQRPKLC